MDRKRLKKQTTKRKKKIDLRTKSRKGTKKSKKRQMNRKRTITITNN